MATKQDVFSGTWRCVHWYPSNKYVGDEADEHRMQCRRDGEKLVFESAGNDKGASMQVYLMLEGDLATGSWHEQTSLTGEYKGATYHGYGQLVVDPKTYHMEGKWAGAGYDRKLKRTRIYTGNWELSPIE